MLRDICKERPAMFINNEHTDSSGLSKNFILFSLSGKSQQPCFPGIQHPQKKKKKSFPNILNHKDDIFRFWGCLASIYLLSHFYFVESKCGLIIGIHLNQSTLFQD